VILGRTLRIEAESAWTQNLDSWAQLAAPAVQKAVSEQLAASVGAPETWGGQPLVQIAGGRINQESGSVEMDVEVLVPPVSGRRLAGEAAYLSRVDDWSNALSNMGDEPQLTELRSQLASSLEAQDLPAPPGMVVSVIPIANGASSQREIEGTDWIQQSGTPPTFEDVTTQSSPAGNTPTVLAAGVFGPAAAAAIIALLGGGYAWKRKTVKKMVGDSLSKLKKKDLQEEVQELGKALSTADNIARGISTGGLTPPATAINLAPLNFVNDQLDRMCENVSPSRLIRVWTPSGSRRPSISSIAASEAVTEEDFPGRAQPDLVADSDLELCSPGEETVDSVHLPNAVTELWIPPTPSSALDAVESTAGRATPAKSRVFQSPRSQAIAEAAPSDETVIISDSEDSPKERPRSSEVQRQDEDWPAKLKEETCEEAVADDMCGSCETGRLSQPESEPSLSGTTPLRTSLRPFSRPFSSGSRPRPLESETVENHEDEAGAQCQPASAGRLRSAADPMDTICSGTAWAPTPEPHSDAHHVEPTPVHVSFSKHTTDSKGLCASPLSALVDGRREAAAASPSRAAPPPSGLRLAAQVGEACTAPPPAQGSLLPGARPNAEKSQGADAKGLRKLWPSIERLRSQRKEGDVGKGAQMAGGRSSVLASGTPAGHRFLAASSPPARVQWGLATLRKSTRVVPFDNGGRAAASLSAPETQPMQASERIKQQLLRLELEKDTLQVTNHRLRDDLHLPLPGGVQMKASERLRYELMGLAKEKDTLQVANEHLREELGLQSGSSSGKEIKVDRVATKAKQAGTGDDAISEGSTADAFARSGAATPLASTGSWSDKLDGYCTQDSFMMTPPLHTMQPTVTVARPSSRARPAPIDLTRSTPAEPKAPTEEPAARPMEVTYNPFTQPLPSRRADGISPEETYNPLTQPLPSSVDTPASPLRSSADDANPFTCSMEMSPTKRGQFRRGGRRTRAFGESSPQHCSGPLSPPRRRSPMKRRASIRINTNCALLQHQDSLDIMLDNTREIDCPTGTGSRLETVPSSTTSTKSWSHANEDYWQQSYYVFS